jgi:sulfhydrogenase subunit beta (sulfur reductase)
MKKVKKQEIAKLLSQWQKDFTVFAPSKESGTAEMAVWDGKDTSFLDWYRNTVVPPKANFLQNMEKLFGFRKEGGSFKLETPAPVAKKQLIFGIRPCDARAIAIIDMVFKDAYEDKYYLSRRQNSLLVGMGCLKPYDSCFCTSLGLSPAEAADMDIMLTDIGGEYVIEEITAKGKELLAGTIGPVDVAGKDELQIKKIKEGGINIVKKSIDVKEITHRLPAAFENKAFWEGVSTKCVSCGICTFLCPTCYCFDINDELLKGDGARYRNWDSCSFPLYTKMPAENPREEKWKRVRQKVNHKYDFYPRLFDVIACTGCGRCIRLCPVNWDITQTLSGLPAGAPVTEKK